jgi:hypothetical protein
MGFDYWGDGSPLFITSLDTSGLDYWGNGNPLNVIASLAPPVASFGYDMIPEQTAPLTVYFYDASTGGPTSWLWDFGDGYTSTSQNPNHTYTVPGTYVISLTATNSGGSDTFVGTDYPIVVLPPPSSYRPILVDGGMLRQCGGSLNLAGIPTSPDGLPTGSCWRDVSDANKLKVS